MTLRRTFLNIVADMLAVLIERDKVDGPIEGVVPQAVDGEYRQSVYLSYNSFYGSNI